VIRGAVTLGTVALGTVNGNLRHTSLDELKDVSLTYRYDSIFIVPRTGMPRTPDDRILTVARAGVNFGPRVGIRETSI